MDGAELAQWKCFKNSRYQRNPVLWEPERYTVMCICWEPAQASPIHNHRGSSCAVVVLNGVCTETIYEPDPAHEGFYRVMSAPEDLGEGGACLWAE